MSRCRQVEAFIAPSCRATDFCASATAAPRAEAPSRPSFNMFHSTYPELRAFVTLSIPVFLVVELDSDVETLKIKTGLRSGPDNNSETHGPFIAQSTVVCPNLAA